MRDNSADVAMGRALVLRYSSMVICISAVIILLYNVNIGQQKLPQQIIRFGLTVLLCYGIYKGSQLARWLAIVLFTYGGVGFLYLLFTATELALIDGIIMGMYGVTYLWFSGLLLGSPKVIAFLNHQRNQRAENIG